jgi:hypothetical protein
MMRSNLPIKSGSPNLVANQLVDINPNTTNSDFVYYDCTSHNYSLTDFMPASYDQTQNIPIINKPSDYKLAVVRLDCNINDVPMFYTANQDMSFTLTYSPDNLTSTQTLFNGTNTAIYLYQQVLDEYNSLLITAWNSIISQYDAIHGPGSWESDPTKPHNYPGITYDESTDRFTLYMDATAPNVVVWSSTYLLTSLFFGVNALPQNVNFLDIGQGGPYNFVFSPTFGNTNIVTLSSGSTGFTGPYIANIQQYSSSSSWYQIRKIVLLSSTLTCRKEYIGPSNTDSSSSIIRSTLTDFSINVSNSGNENPLTKYIYYPAAEYRYIDLFGSEPLYRLQFFLYYSTDTEAIAPIMIPPGKSFSIKLLFTKRVV